MLKLLLITLGIVALAVVFLALKLLLKGDARGPMTHIGASKAMRQRGIHCVESMDTIERHQLANRPHATEKRKNTGANG
ncbi:MAG: hypothetical protein K6C30_00775 [Bacteroidaceae bacterium]|nr:hypothetical protein [Bacteroidaceae bacterium]